VSYAAITDVLAPFPRFQQALPNNITNAAIQGWLDQGKAEIRARFLRRSIDPDVPPSLGWDPPLTVLTPDQTNVLVKFNAAYGIVWFGNAAYNQLNEGELAIVKFSTKLWQSMMSRGVEGRGSICWGIAGRMTPYSSRTQPTSLLAPRLVVIPAQITIRA
jgi:hypothetical protein